MENHHCTFAHNNSTQQMYRCRTPLNGGVLISFLRSLSP